jgi:hypothetical protein
VKKRPHFQPSLITNNFFKHHKTPETINEGECFIWAYLAHLVFKGVELWHAPTHAFVRYRGRFYDSQRLRGELNWRDLPAADWDERDKAVRSSASVFKHEWRGQPKEFDTSWAEIEAKARRLLRHAQASI